MILADTNVLVALLVDGRDAQRDAALTAIGEAQRSGRAVVVTESVLVEVCWVLERSYDVSRALVAEALQPLVSAPPLRPWDDGLTREALALMARQPALSITDCLLACRAAREGAGILTFDRGLGNAVSP